MAAARMNGACHCGAVQFRVTLPDGFDTICRPTCSYCRMRGAIAVSAKRDDLEIMAGRVVVQRSEAGHIWRARNFR